MQIMDNTDNHIDDDDDVSLDIFLSFLTPKLSSCSGRMLLMLVLLLWWWWHDLWLGPLPLLLIANSPGFSLKIANLAEIKPHSSGSERIRFRSAAVLFVSSPQASDERVEAAPSLSQRARTGCGRVG